jgi:FdhE protein
VTQDFWLRTHPYLESVSSLHTQVDKAVSELSIVPPPVPIWDNYIGDFLGGVPLLRSPAASIDFAPVEVMTRALVKRLATSSLPDSLAGEARILDAELHCEADPPQRVAAWLLDENTFATECPGLLRYLGWTAMSRYLQPVTDSFRNWRDEERWLRSYCPMCGSSPAMAQLVGADQGRQRLLACGCCRTRWRYKRTGCPFCDNEDDRRLPVMTVEGEEGLRIDYCESCKGYLKTYDGEGSETLLLADWTSIQLDVIACDRGLKRIATSLYEL